MMPRNTSFAIGIGFTAPASHADCAPWASGTNLLHQPRLGRTALPNGRSDRSGASVWTISSSWARRICAESCEPMLAITTTSERTGHWTKMRRSLAPFSGPESLVHTRSLADFITTTSGFRFSVQTGLVQGVNGRFAGEADSAKLDHASGMSRNDPKPPSRGSRF